MVAALLLLIVIVDTAATAWLLATVRGVKRVCSRNATLIKRLCEEESSDGRPDPDDLD